MPYGWDQSQRSYERAQNNDFEKHKSSFGDDALAGAASFSAFKIFEERQRKEGKQASHQSAKELLVGIADAEVDKLIDTKGLHYVDREKAKRHAKENAEHLYEEHYERGGAANYLDYAMSVNVSRALPDTRDGLKPVHRRIF